MSFLSRVWKSKSFIFGVIQIAVGGVAFATGFDPGAVLIGTGINSICGKDATAKVSNAVDKVNDTVDLLQKKIDEIQKKINTAPKQ